MATINYRFQFKEAGKVKKAVASMQGDFMKELTKEVGYAMSNSAGEIQEALDGLVGPWEHSVNFIVGQSHLSQSSISINILTDDPAFNYLERGTGVRHAALTDDWQSKTSVGSLYSGQGRGSVKFVSEHYNAPGIEARKFYKAVSDEYKPKFRENVRKAYLEAFKKVGF